MGSLKFLKDAFKSVIGIVDKVVVDKDKRAELKAELQRLEANIDMKIISMEMQIVKSKASVIQAEAAGEDWIQRSWRPYTMVVFVFVVIWAVILVPLFKLPPPDVNNVPPEVWSIIKLGLGGYIIGRSVEGAVKKWRNN